MQTRIHIRSKHYFTFEGLDNSERIYLLSVYSPCYLIEQKQHNKSTDLLSEKDVILWKILMLYTQSTQ